MKAASERQNKVAATLAADLQTQHQNGEINEI